MAWLTNWSYRKAIVIAHTADGAQTDYQMKLLVGESSGATGEQIDCDGLVASDFDDLRFTTSDGTTLCSYWIESLSGSTPNQLATIWIKIPSIAAHPDDTTIYMYYGGTTTAVNSITATFPFADHFDDASIDGAKWYHWYDNGSESESGTEFAITGHSSYNAWGAKTKYGTNYAFRGRVYISSEAGNDVALFYGDERSADGTSSGAADGAGFRIVNPSLKKYSTCDNAGGTLSARDDSVTSFAILEVQRNSTTNVKMLINDVLKATHTTNLPTANIGLLFYADSAVVIHIDWVVVRKFTVNEPTWGSFGKLESIKNISNTIELKFLKIKRGFGKKRTSKIGIIINAFDEVFTEAAGIFERTLENVKIGVSSSYKRSIILSRSFTSKIGLSLKKAINITKAAIKSSIGILFLSFERLVTFGRSISLFLEFVNAIFSSSTFITLSAALALKAEDIIRKISLIRKISSTLGISLIQEQIHGFIESLGILSIGLAVSPFSKLAKLSHKISSTLGLLISTINKTATLSLSLRPNGDTARTGFVTETAGTTNLYASIDEAAADDNTTYITIESLIATATYTGAITNHTTERGTINSVTMHYRAASENTSGAYTGHQGGCAVNDTNYLTSMSYTAIGTTYANFSISWNTNPNTGAAWEWPDIDALSIYLVAYSSANYYLRITQAYIVVDYTTGHDVMYRILKPLIGLKIATIKRLNTFVKPITNKISLLITPIKRLVKLSHIFSSPINLVVIIAIEAIGVFNEILSTTIGLVSSTIQRLFNSGRKVPSTLGLFITFDRLAKYLRIFNTNVGISLLQEKIASIFKELSNNISLVVTLTRGLFESNRIIKPTIGLISSSIKKLFKAQRKMYTKLGLISIIIKGIILNGIKTTISLASAFSKQFSLNRKLPSIIAFYAKINRLFKAQRKISTSMIVNFIGDVIVSITKLMTTLVGLTSSFKRGFFLQRNFEVQLGITSILQRLFYKLKSISGTIGLVAKIGVKEVGIVIKEATIALISSFSRLFKSTRKFITASIALLSASIVWYFYDYSEGLEQFERKMDSVIMALVTGSMKKLYLAQRIFNSIILNISLIHEWAIAHVEEFTALTISLISILSKKVDFKKKVLSSIELIISTISTLSEWGRIFISYINLITLKSLGISKKIFVSIGFFAIFNKIANFNKRFLISLSLISLISLVSAYTRRIYAKLGINLLKERIIEIFREFFTNIGLLAIIGNIETQVIKIFSITIGLATLLTKQVFWNRIISNVFGLISSSTSTIITLYRIISTNIVLLPIFSKFVEWKRQWSSYLNLNISQLHIDISLSKIFSAIVIILSKETIITVVDYTRKFILKIELTPIFNRLIKIIRKFVTNIFISLLSETFIEILKKLTTSIGVVSSFTRQVNWRRLFTNQIALLSSIIEKLFSFGRSLVTTINIDLLQEWISEWIRDFTIVVEFVSSFTIVKVFNIFITSSIKLVSTFTKVLGYTRKWFVSISLNSFILRLSIIGRTFENILSIDLLSEKLTKYFREITTAITLSVFLLKIHTMYRVLNTSLAISALFSRIVMYRLSIKVLIGLTASSIIKGITIIKKALFALVSIVNKTFMILRNFNVVTIGLKVLFVRLLDIIGYKSLKFIRDIYKVGFLNTYKNIKFWKRTDR